MIRIAVLVISMLIGCASRDVPMMLDAAAQDASLDAPSVDASNSSDAFDAREDHRYMVLPDVCLYPCAQDAADEDPP